MYINVVVILLWLTDSSFHNDDGSCNLLEIDSPVIPLSFGLNKSYALFERQSPKIIDKDEEKVFLYHKWSEQKYKQGSRYDIELPKLAAEYS